MSDAELVTFKLDEAIQGPSFKFTDVIEKDNETYVKLSEVYKFTEQQINFRYGGKS